MRIAVKGDCDSAKSLAGLLKKAGLVVNSGSAEYTIEIDESDTSDVIVDGVDSTLERLIIHEMENAGIPRFVLQRAGGVRNDRIIHISVPAGDTELQKAVEYGCLRGLLSELEPKQVEVKNLETVRTVYVEKESKRPWYKKLIPFLLVLVAPLADAQNVQFITARFWDEVNAVLVNPGDSANSALRVNIVAGAGSGGTASTFGAAFPSSGTAAGFFDGTNMQGARVFDLDSGGGTQFGLGVNLRQIASGGSIEVPFPLALGGSGGFKVECLSGCGGPAGFTDDSAFTGASTSIGNVGFLYDATPPTITDGNAGIPRMNSSRIILVDFSSSGALPAGTNNIGDFDVVSFPDNEPFNLSQIAGTAPNAHDGVISSDTVPLTTSAYSETPEDSDGNTSGNRVSADADKVRLLANRYGVLYTNPCQGPFKWTYHENSSSTLTDTTVHGSCGTGLYNYICSVTASTGSATAWNMFIEDSTSTTILGPFYLEAVAGRGFHISFAAEGGKRQTNSATLISVTTSAAIAHSIEVQGACAP